MSHFHSSFAVSRRAALACIALLSYAGLCSAQTTPLRVITHSSFSIDKKLLAQFETEHQTKLEIIKAGDAGEMLNKLILTRRAPIADVVFGLDNALLPKARAENVLAPLPAPETPDTGKFKSFNLGPDALAIDYGYINLNADRAALKAKGLPMPSRLEDLTKPAYKNMLVVQNPATSSTGLGFFLATLQHLGEPKVWNFWQQLKDNGVRVAPGWTQAYQKEFSLYGGSRPLVVSYGTSPAAEVFYSEGKHKTPPTDSIWAPGSWWLQVEAAGVIQGSQQGKLARQFIDFMRSAAVQSNIPTQMWVYPVREGLTLDPVMQWASAPATNELTMHTPPQAQQLSVQLRKWAKLMRAD